MAGAYETGVYRNIFKECGYSEEEIEKRVKETFETIFYGSEEERFYHEAGADMGYMEDTGNHDVRTEGMSYGMMVCVQMNRKKEFDRLWKWVRTYMYIEDGPGKNILPGRVLSMVQETRTDRHRMEKNILQWRSFLLQRDGEMEKAFSITAARQEQFYGNVSIRESQGIQESRCGIRKII